MKQADYAALHAELPQIYTLRDAAALPVVMLQALRRLIPCLFCTYNRIDHGTGRVLAAYHPPEWQGEMESLMPHMAPHLESHPVYRNVSDTGDGSPRCVSDFVGEEEWSLTPFGIALETIGVRDSMIFCLHTSRQELIFLALNRPDRSFSDRDREMAATLRPHLAAAYENALAFTEAQALALLSARAIESASQGVALVDRLGNILHTNALAGELMHRFFPGEGSWKAVLPNPVKSWLIRQRRPEAAPADPMEVGSGNSCLRIRSATLSGDRSILLFQETDMARRMDRLRALGLTQREAEVLHWVGEGKSNTDVGTILAISPRTVGKHLETIFRKIHVETRVAAALRAKEVAPS